jgi:hypothetical protein
MFTFGVDLSYLFVLVTLNTSGSGYYKVPRFFYVCMRTISSVGYKKYFKKMNQFLSA